MAPDPEPVIADLRKDVLTAAGEAVDTARQAGRALRIRLLVDGENWLEVLPLAVLCERHAAELELRIHDVDGATPLAELPIEEARGIHRALVACRGALAGPTASGCLAPGAFDTLLQRIREMLLQRASATADRAEEVLRGRGGRFALPDPDHILFGEEARSFAVLAALLDLGDAPSLLDWARRIAARPDVESIAAAHPWLRLLLQKLALDDASSEALTLLRALYSDPRRRMRLIDEERVAIARHAAGWGWEQRQHRLGLQAPARERRFPTAVAAGLPDGSVRVTVVVPSYRHERWIAASLASLLAQREVAVRILVADDASGDGTVAAARAVGDPRIEVRENPRNLGLGSSLNAALAGITTEYVALLNSDDLFHPERLARCLQILDAQPQTDVVATAFEFIDEQDRIVTPENVSVLFDGPQIAMLVRWFASVQPVDPAPEHLFAELLARNFLATSSNIVARTPFVTALAPRLEGLRYCVDWQVFLAAAARDRLAVLREPLVAYRLHGRNTVWFAPEARTDYFLEVARVAAGAVQDRIAGAGSMEQRVDLAAALVARPLLASTEVDGHALFLNALVDPLTLARLQRSGREVNAAAEQIHRHWQQRNDAVRLAAALSSGSPGALWLAASVRLARIHTGLLQEALAAVREEQNRRPEPAPDRLGQRGSEHASTEAAALRYSREYRTGDLIWNRLPLTARAAGLLKTGWRRAGNRLSLARLRLRRPTTAAVVAGSEVFPHWAHTFVYDEMLALHGAGLQPVPFYWTSGDWQKLAPSHLPLRRNSTRLRGVAADHRQDLARWRRRQPTRLHGLLERIAAATGLEPQAIEADWDFLRACTFARFVETAGAKWIHTFFFYAQSFFGLVAAALTGRPRGITAYADHVLDDYRFKLVGLHLASADLVVATSQRACQELLARGGPEHAAKILVKPNGVDVRSFTPVRRTRASGGGISAVSVSRFEPKKGLLELLAAAASARSAGLDLRLELVGAPDPYLPGSLEYSRALQQRVAELDLGDAVRIRGFVRRDELPTVLAQADVFVAPYLQTPAGDKDGIPTALLEAMAAGLPVVVTDAGALTEAVQDGLEGLVVTGGTPAGLAAALQRLAADGALCDRLGRAARARVEAEFSRATLDRRLQERIAALLGD